MSRDRAWRRYQKYVRRERRRRWYWLIPDSFGSRFTRFLGKIVDTPCLCSCWMCGSPRLAFKGKERFLMQELRANEVKEREVNGHAPRRREGRPVPPRRRICTSCGFFIGFDFESRRARFRDLCEGCDRKAREGR